MTTQIKFIKNPKLCKFKCHNFCKKYFLAYQKFFKTKLENNKYSINVAIIDIPNNYSIYISQLGRKSKRNFRKFDKDQKYYLKIFKWNDHLDDIYDINTSKMFRRNRIMSDSYLKYPKKKETIFLNNKDFLKSKDFCSNHLFKFFGCFEKKTNKLVSYATVVFLDEFATFSQFIGHGDHLSNNIMYGLIGSIIKDLINNKSKYLMYLNLNNNSLGRFKKNVGFKEKRLDIVSF